MFAAMPKRKIDVESGDAPTRVAIVGGGVAALTTAFELTSPELGGRYAVTVYQMGWWLGGKGASSRGVADRIEEHGLHLWMGFYENAFRLMRECYAELPPLRGGRRRHLRGRRLPAPGTRHLDARGRRGVRFESSIVSPTSGSRRRRRAKRRTSRLSSSTSRPA